MKGDEIYCWGVDVLAYYPEQKKLCLDFIKNKNQNYDNKTNLLLTNQKDIEKNDLNEELNKNIKFTTRIINGVRVSNI